MEQENIQREVDALVESRSQPGHEPMSEAEIQDKIDGIEKRMSEPGAWDRARENIRKYAHNGPCGSREGGKGEEPPRLEALVVEAVFLGERPWEHGVTVEHFYDKRFQEIWLATDRLRASGERLGLNDAEGELTPRVGIARELERSGKLDMVGGHAFLMDIGEPLSFGEVFSVEGNSRLLIRRHAETEYDKKIKKITDDKALTPDQKMEALEKASDLLDALTTEKPWHEIETAAGEYLDWEEKQNSLNRLAFGIPTIDKRLGGGMAPGYYGVLGARPGSGKSTIGINIMQRLAGQHGVIYVSFEMSRFRIMQGMQAGRKELLGHFKEGDYDITFIESGRKIVQLVHILERVIRERKPKIIIIDHFHLIRGEGDSLYEQRTGVSKELQSVAQNTGVALLSLAQLTRAPANENRPPRISDLRDSGSIEEEADFVLLLHKTADNQSVLRLVKNRDTGEQGECVLVYDPKTRQLTEKVNALYGDL